LKYSPIVTILIIALVSSLLGNKYVISAVFPRTTNYFTVPQMMLTVTQQSKDEIEIKQLIKQLGSTEYKVKNGAVENLINIGKPAVEPLIETLDDESRFVRGNAAETLGKIESQHPDVSITLTAKLGDRYSEILQAHILIGQREWDKVVAIGELAVEPLIKALDDNWERSEAAKALGKIRDVKALEPLIKSLEDDDSDVRREAAESLVNIGEPAVELLINVYHTRSRLKDTVSRNLKKDRSTFR